MVHIIAGCFYRINFYAKNIGGTLYSSFGRYG